MNSKQVSTDAPGDGNAREAILQAAERLFAERGFDSITVNEIALAAGASKANIFHHFGSKQDLYMAVLKVATDRAGGDVGRRAAAEEGDVPERLGLFMANYLTVLITHPHSSRLIMREVMENGEKSGAALARELFTDNFVRIVSLIRAGQACGVLRKDLSAELLAVLMVGVNVFFFHTRAVMRHLPGVAFADAPEDFSRGALELLMNGALAPANQECVIHEK